MKIKLNKDECIGCGACTVIMADLFEMGDDGKARLKGGVLKGKFIEKDLAKNSDDAAEAASSCPVEAIKVEKR